MSAVPFPDLPLSVRYAISSVCAVARADRPLSTPHLAEATGAPRPFLAKVLGALVTAELLEGVRGRTGGFRLARSADAITIRAIVDAVQDRPHAPRICAMRNQPCDDADPCAMHTRWMVASEPVKAMLRTTTIADLTA